MTGTDSMLGVAGSPFGEGFPGSRL